MNASISVIYIYFKMFISLDSHIYVCINDRDVQLKAKKNELDEKSEELGAAFVEGKMELAQFLTVSASQSNAGWSTCAPASVCLR